MTLQRKSDDHVLSHRAGAAVENIALEEEKLYRRHQIVCSTLYCKYITTKIK